MVTNLIQKTFAHAKTMGWTKMYWAIDVHETMIYPNWKEGSIPTEFYLHAKEALQLISSRKDIVTILYTCSHPHEIDQYLTYFKENGIRFDYVNENPEVINKKYGNYSRKPYFNVLLEDKAGFEPSTDWPEVIRLLNEYELLS